MWEWFNQIGTLLSIICLVFTAGYNWRRIAIIEGLLDKHLTSVDTRRNQLDLNIERTYARKDTLELELKAIRSRLDYISKQLDAMRS